MKPGAGRQDHHHRHRPGRCGSGFALQASASLRNDHTQVQAPAGAEYSPMAPPAPNRRRGTRGMENPDANGDRHHRRRRREQATAGHHQDTERFRPTPRSLLRTRHPLPLLPGRRRQRQVGLARLLRFGRRILYELRKGENRVAHSFIPYPKRASS